MTFSKLATYLLIGTAVVPLAFSDIFFYPAVTTKTMFFATLTLLSVALLSVGVARGEELYWNRLKRKSVWIPLTLLVIAYLASLLGIDFYHSFWGLFDRGAGLLYGLTLPIFAFYCALLSFTKKDGERFLKLVSITATLVSVLALFQWGVNALNLPIEWLDTHGARIGGTLGNAAFLAAYLGMSIWITYIVHGMSPSKKWRTFAIISIVLQMLTILVTATRGTMLALLVSLFFLVVWFAVKGNGRKKTYARYAVGAFIILIALFFGFRTQIAQIPFEPIQRIATISLSDPTTANRLFVWSESLNVSTQHFVTGVGAELIASTFNTWYDPGKVSEEWFDRTHNIYIDYLLQFGIFGLMAYLALLIGFVIAVLKGGLLTRERYALLLILLTYAIQNLFVFDTVSTFPLLLFLFVYAHIRETDTTAPYPKKGLAKLGYAKAAVFVLLLIPVVILPSYANVLASTGYKYHVTDVQKANELFDQSYSLDTYIDIELGWQLYTMYTTRQQHLTDPNDRLAAYDKAYAVLSQNAERYPYDARTLTYLAHVIDSRPAEAPYDEEAYRTLLARILELSPKRAQTWYLTANILLKEGDKLAGAAREAKYEEAMSVLEEYSALVPDIATPYFIKANLYIALGNFTKAEEAFAEGEQLYQKGRREDARRATAYLITREEFERVEPYLEDLVVEEPTKENIYDLAKIKYINGKLDEAVRLVNRVYILDKTYIKSDPSFLAAFLSAYNEGGSTVKLNIEL